jgi:hypothetical protein
LEKTTNKGAFSSVLVTKRYSGDQIKNEKDGVFTRMDDWRGTYRVLVGRPEGKKRLRRTKREYENTNKTMDVLEVGWGHELDCSGLG